jgi:4-hydroxy-tetrahydrodipicolinate synthase
MLVAAVSPRRSQEYSIDLGATLELIDFLGESGLDGITLLGSTGEFVHFALDDRRHMVNFAAKRSRVPLLVNVSHSTLDGAVELAREAARAGVAGVLVMPPYYFTYDQESIRSFFLTFASQAPTGLPIYLYNIPSCTNLLAASTATELLATGQFAGIKDSGGTLEYLAALVEQSKRAPFTIFSGSEPIYVQSRCAGANGAISGCASAIPEVMVALERAILKGDEQRAAQIHARVMEFIAAIVVFPMPVGIKEALKLRKLKAGVHASPLGPEGDRKLAAFGNWFRAWLPEVLRECAQ